MSAGKKRALLVGVQEYDNPAHLPPLSFTIRDVEEIGKTLREVAGFEEVIAMTSDIASGSFRPNRQNVIKQLNRMKRESGPEDTLLFYFTGHGFDSGEIHGLLPASGETYLATVNTDPESLVDLEESSLSFNRLRHILENISASHLLFFLDACRNSPGKSLTSGMSNLFAKDISLLAKGGGEGVRGIGLMASCRQGQRSFEWEEKQHGVFTYYLLEGMRGEAFSENGALTFNDLAHYVEQKMQEHRNSFPAHRQTLYPEQSGTARILLAERIIPGKITPLSTSVVFEVKSNPAGAQVYLEDELRGVTPCTLSEPVERNRIRTVRLELALVGYQDEAFDLSLERNINVFLPPVEMRKIPVSNNSLIKARRTLLSTIQTIIQLKTLANSALQIVEPSQQIKSLVLRSKTAPNRNIINPMDGAEMILIPACEFMMGDEDQYNHQPHKVILSEYYIYTNLVTVGQYEKYSKLSGKQMPPAPFFDSRWAKKNHPVVNVTWQDARDYCKWATEGRGDLPSEAQWERAARGLQGLKYPWGNEFDGSKLWFTKGGKMGTDIIGTAKVGIYGFSPDGLSDMAGNVKQWCLDGFDSEFWTSTEAKTKNPVNSKKSVIRVLKGVSWDYVDAELFHTSYRGSYFQSNRGYNNGFRCAMLV